MCGVGLVIGTSGLAHGSLKDERVQEGAVLDPEGSQWVWGISSSAAGCASINLQMGMAGTRRDLPEGALQRGNPKCLAVLQGTP